MSLSHPSKVPSAIEAGLGSHGAQGDAFLSELGECVRITEDPKGTIVSTCIYSYFGKLQRKYHFHRKGVVFV